MLNFPGNHVVAEIQHPVAPLEPASLPQPSSSAVGVAANLAVPQEPHAPGFQQHHRSVSTLSFLLNDLETEDTNLPTIAQVLQTSSTSDLRDAIDAFTS